MGMHGTAIAITSDLTEAARILERALASFKSGHLILASAYVNLAQAECEQTDKPAEDFGRLLLELAYEMGRAGVDDEHIDTILRRASMVMVNTMSGSIEAFLTAARVRLLQRNPTSALRLCSHIAAMFEAGWPAEATLIKSFELCKHQAEKELAEQNAKIAELERAFYTEER